VLAMRSISAVLVGAIVLFLTGGLGVQTCSSCCPALDDRGPALSSLACCGEGCAERLAAGQERPCLTSARSDAAKSPVLPVTIVSLRSASAAYFESSLRQSLWLPASPRSGTRPLRL
jgi:hypothetical protein